MQSLIKVSNAGFKCMLVNALQENFLEYFVIIFYASQKFKIKINKCKIFASYDLRNNVCTTIYSIGVGVYSSRTGAQAPSSPAGECIWLRTEYWVRFNTIITVNSNQ